MVLIVQLSAVLSLAKEYLFAARMHLSVLGHIIYFPFVNCPTVVLLVVLSNFFSGVKCSIRVFNDVLDLFRLLHEFLNFENKFNQIFLRKLTF